MQQSELIAQTETPDLSSEPKRLIIVSGFGPFIGHEEVNASWEAVKLLPDVLRFENEELILEKEEIPVEYEKVDEAVQRIWSRKPMLVIHCGVNGQAESVFVEKLAYNNKFNRPDYAGKMLAKATATLCAERSQKDSKVIFCGLNVDRIVKSVAEQFDDKNGTGCKVRVSKNVGNYLCGYIYLKSLDKDCNRTLFLHVPPVDNPFSSEQTSDIIFKIVEECVKELNDCECGPSPKKKK